MAATSSPLLRSSGRRDSSSIANITPPSGVLKAAAMPAAPPATSRPCSLTEPRSGSQRRALCSTPAAICTDGPSRPSDRPPSRPVAVRKILPMLRRSDTNMLRWVWRTSVSIAAITCWMPDPAAPAK